MQSALVTHATKQVNGIGFSFSQTNQVDGSNQKYVTATVPAASTNASLNATWPASQLLTVLLADQDCTLKTNSPSSPTNTLLLKANQPLIWQSATGYFSNPFSADVTSAYVTCTLETNLQVYLLS